MLSDINLIETQNWHDLLQPALDLEQETAIFLAPYQCAWITNYPT